MKYKHQPARKQIDALKIEIKKDKKGKIKGFTIWADGYWVLDGSVLKDKDENFCRVYLGNRIQQLQFEYVEEPNIYLHERFLELRSKKKTLN